MTEGAIQDASAWVNRTIDEAIKGAIEEQVRRRMPEIVGAACAAVTANMSSFLNVERMGTDLRITVLNAYKPEIPL